MLNDSINIISKDQNAFRYCKDGNVLITKDVESLSNIESDLHEALIYVKNFKKQCILSMR